MEYGSKWAMVKKSYLGRNEDKNTADSEWSSDGSKQDGDCDQVVLRRPRELHPVVEWGNPQQS